MRKFLTFLFGAVLALCFLGCPNAAGGANSGNGGSNSTSGNSGARGSIFDETPKQVPTSREQLSEENKTLLKDILTSLKEDPIYTSIPDNDKPNLETCKVNLYNNKNNCILTLATLNNKVIGYYVQQDGGNFEFYDLLSYVKNETNNMYKTQIKEINEGFDARSNLGLNPLIYIINEVMYLEHDKNNQTHYLKLSTAIKQIPQLFLTIDTQKLSDKIKLKSRLVAEFDDGGKHYSIDETMDEIICILNNRLYKICQYSEIKKYDFWSLMELNFETKITTQNGKRQVIQYDHDGVEIIENGNKVYQRIWTEEQTNVWSERNGLWDPEISTIKLTILEGDFWAFFSKVVNLKTWD